ncbi:hypothetical protein J6590_071375 [Homalodisca vitripennis]|nr:hypothetical protein J6590_071375 [Homalodisca vitripennis]
MKTHYSAGGTQASHWRAPRPVVTPNSIHSDTPSFLRRGDQSLFCVLNWGRMSPVNPPPPTPPNTTQTTSAGDEPFIADSFDLTRIGKYRIVFIGLVKSIVGLKNGKNKRQRINNALSALRPTGRRAAPLCRNGRGKYIEGLAYKLSVYWNNTYINRCAPARRGGSIRGTPSTALIGINEIASRQARCKQTSRRASTARARERVWCEPQNNCRPEPRYA